MDEIIRNILGAKNIMKNLGYEPLDNFSYSCIVYKTLELGSGMNRIFKTTDSRDVIWCLDHILHEKRVLDSIKGVRNINQYLMFYDFRQGDLISKKLALKYPVALVKEYLERIDIEGNWSGIGKIGEKNFKILEEVVHAAHEAGFSNLDLRLPNIIIDLAKEPHLIDLGSATYKYESRSIGNFEFWKREDLVRLDELHSMLC
ncbi:MAG: hypothetical protein Q7S33_01375 [Nanoarchaeota archaeon]|nr:hypothetical protein [Nanoarchaeota archaeon]